VVSEEVAALVAQLDEIANAMLVKDGPSEAAGTMLRAAGWLNRLSAPSPQGAGLDREEVARIIDPMAWAPSRKPGKYMLANHVREAALAKADDIIALRRGPRETPATIAAWAEQTFGRPASLRDIVYRAKREMDELVEAVDEGAESPRVVGEAADVLIVLSQVFAFAGADMWGEVDAKMAVNRAREWIIEGPGFGRHKP
jgi:NTP pyrophosphatase (non-canonical NTP hydrolase)